MNLIKTRKNFTERISTKERVYSFVLVLWSVFIYTLLTFSLVGMLMMIFYMGSHLDIESLTQTYPTAFSFLFYIPLFLFISLIISLCILGEIRGNSIKATEKQFPIVMKLLEEQTKALGMDYLPTVYITNGNGMLQALALRVFARDYIVLYSDVLSTAIDKEGEDVVAFILGHELAHIRRGHVSLFWNLLILPGLMIPFLVSAYSRACEYTCDAVGHYLAPKGAERGITLLAAGKHLYKNVDLEEYKRTGFEDRSFATWCHEIISTHPHLVKRLTAIQKWNKGKL